MEQTINEKLVLHVCTNPIFRTKINKMLFFIDALSFKKNKKSISNFTYLKLPYGPVPKEIKETSDNLIESGKLVEYEKKNMFGSLCFVSKVKDKRILEDCKLEKEEKDVYDSVYDNLFKYTVGYLSELSHRIDPWKSASYGDELDLSKLPDNTVALIEEDGHIEYMKDF